MSVEDRLFQQRYHKIREIENLGFEAYPRKYVYTHTPTEIREAFDQKPAEELDETRPRVSVCGRLMTKRRQGKAGFCHIQKDGEQTQLYVRQDAVGERDFDLYKALDAGDFIGCEGYVFRTKTGELTVHAEKLEFLAKAISPLPEKYHGLQDVETRYRQRYVDLFANEDARKVFVKRNRMIKALRGALDARGYIEVETPMMQQIHGGALARPFKTHHNTLDMDLFLRIAPELYLKRLVVGGLDKVYEINRNFRNEGLSMRHNPEFTMLEFYQAYSDYRDLMDFSEELLRTAAEAVLDGGTKARFREQDIDFATLARFTLREAICEFWPHDGAKPTLEELKDLDRVKQLVAGHNRNSDKKIHLRDDATLGTALQSLFEETCEARLIQPTLIYEYPVEASPLSKQKPDDPDWVERFEIYAAGMELANAYSELNDPQEQRKRFELQVSMQAHDAEAHQMDEDYLRALSYGMPPTAGEGFGIDRLTMILTDSPTIRDVILFPLLRPEGEIGMAERLRAAETSTPDET